MSLLRRYYHRHLRHHHRFQIAVLVTIVAVSYAAVPAVVSLVNALGSYNPAQYEPKDEARGEWLDRRGPLRIPALSWDDVLKISLFILAGIAWLAVAPSRPAPRRSPRR